MIRFKSNLSTGVQELNDRLTDGPAPRMFSISSVYWPCMSHPLRNGQFMTRHITHR